MVIYVIDKGDTIYRLSREYDVPMGKIIEDNQVPDVNRLVIGSSLVIVNEEGVPDEYKMGSVLVNGYCYPDVDTEVLNTSLPSLTYLGIFSYQISPDGGLIQIDDERVIQAALDQHTESRMVITNIGEEGQFSNDLARTILDSEELQGILLENCIQIMENKDYTGLDVDFEYLYPEDREKYNRFLERARNRLNPLGYTLSTAIAPKLSGEQQGLLYEAHDYSAHGRYADEVIIMTYEWGFLYGPPMAVAPLDRVRKVIEYAVSEIPSEKILMGIPNYGYDWTLPYEPGSAARIISSPQAIEIAMEVGAQIQFDETAASPFFTYYDEEKRQHIVWFEDARSIYEKLRLVEAYNLGGVSYWTVNNKFNQNWVVLQGLYDVKKNM